jgi:hypothetical protein
MKFGIALAVVTLCGGLAVNGYAQTTGTVKKEKAKDVVTCPHHADDSAGKAVGTKAPATVKHATGAKAHDCCKKDAKGGSAEAKTMEDCMKKCEGGKEDCAKKCAKQDNEDCAGKH